MTSGAPLWRTWTPLDLVRERTEAWGRRYAALPVMAVLPGSADASDTTPPMTGMSLDREVADEATPATNIKAAETTLDQEEKGFCLFADVVVVVTVDTVLMWHHVLGTEVE